tara:strand:+ start:15785 stop:16045 length:261 start_codon:yes stop_codon:yes gene_type:complete
MPSTDFVDENAYNDYSDDDEREEPQPLDIQNWMDWYSNDLLNMWMGLRTYREDTYLTNSLMGDATFHDFCEFVYKFSHGFQSNKAT